MVSILTPTYNRGYIIKKLYQSLLVQKDKKFEWIVIDDGSFDNTEKVFQKILEEGKINLRYIKKENGGKHTAINKGVEFARGEIVIIVDSDDYLTENAIQRIRQESQKIINKKEFAGVSFRKIRISDQQIIGSNLLKDEYIDTNSIEYRYKYGVSGDIAECFKLEILKKFPFPIYKNEKFVPEALIWNRIANNYKMRFFNNEGLYMCEYLPDGYSQQFNELRKKNPEAYKDYYKEEIYNRKIPLRRKIGCLLRILQIKRNRK